MFSVNAAYDCLTKHSANPQSEVYNLLWKAKAFPNVLMTAWRVMRGRMPSRLCLSRRGVLMNSMLCPLCQLEEESSQHIFLHCKYAQWVWSECFKWIGTSTVQHNDLMHFLNFYLFQATKKQNLVWKGVWVNVIRCIWDQRNLIVFQQGVVDADEIFQKVQLKSWLWLKHRTHSFNYSFANWVLNPVICLRSVK